LPSLFETRRRLPTSATAFSTCEQPNPSSSILAGTEASTSFLFFVASRPLPCGSGETWRAALRPAAATPVPVPPACAGLPDRDGASDAPPPWLAPRSVVRIDVHGSKDRAKDASPFVATISCGLAGAYAWLRMLTTFPSSAPSGHPLSSARSHRGRIPVAVSGPT